MVDILTTTQLLAYKKRIREEEEKRKGRDLGDSTILTPCWKEEVRLKVIKRATKNKNKTE